MANSLPRVKINLGLPGYDPLKPLKTLLKFLFVLFIVSAAVFFLLRLYQDIGSRVSSNAHEKRYLMGTIFEIQAYGVGAKEASQKALDSMERLSRILSSFDPKSEISLVNGMAGVASVAVSRDTFDIIERTLKISESLDGKFDITVGPLMDIWDFKKGNFVLPSNAQVLEALRLVDYRKIALYQEILSVKLLSIGMKLDLGGVGKGYAIATGRNVLVSMGIKSALISTGSSISCIGTRPDGNPWMVGIKDPRNSQGLLGVVALKPGQALSTSGDYERYIDIAGKRYHHIIDPETGYPADKASAVTVISNDAILADILSTAAFVMGPAEGIRMLSSFSDVSGMIVDGKGKIFWTPGFTLLDAGENKTK